VCIPLIFFAVLLHYRYIINIIAIDFNSTLPLLNRV
jgi:hypothetical protein